MEDFGASGRYILGEEVRRFEVNLAAYWKRRYAVGVASGLDAIELSLRILGCGSGDRVLTSPISAFATVLSILKLGATPVFADCDRYGLIDLAACRKLLECNSDIRYFVPVHLYGHTLDSGCLNKLRWDFDLLIVEDCAQSIGAASGRTPTGGTGQLAATSFYPTKNLGSLGDGGAILTDSAELAQEARKLRDYGQSRKYVHDAIGYNSRLDEIQAAFMNRAFLPRLSAWTERRREIARRYCTEISNPRVAVPGFPEGSEPSWHIFPVLIQPDRKADFQSFLQKWEIQSGEHYPLALVEQPALCGVELGPGGDCPGARNFCHSEVSLPVHPYLSDDEVTQVIGAANNWMG